MKRQHFDILGYFHKSLKTNEKNDVYEFEEKRKKNCRLQHTQARRRFHFNWNAVVWIVRITRFDI